jgi:hypothetical protein
MSKNIDACLHLRTLAQVCIYAMYCHNVFGEQVPSRSEQVATREPQIW